MKPSGGWTQQVKTWGEMVKFSHSVFALPFALMAVFLAARNLPSGPLPEIGQVILIIMCMVAARSVAMTFNRIVDAQIDARNPRTANRPIPAGRITHTAAWSMLGLAAITFLVACLGFYMMFENSWPVLLSGPVLAYLCGYSLTKRFTRYSHFYLGSAIAFAPVAAWLAIDPSSVGYPAIVLMISVTCWIAGFDIIYACQDIQVDVNEGLHSLPSKLGPAKALWVARCAHVVTVIGLITLGTMESLGWIYFAGVITTALLLIVENALVKPNDYRHVTLAFFTINGIISLLLATTTILDILIL